MLLSAIGHPAGDRWQDHAGHLGIALHLDQWAEAENRRTDPDARHKAGYTQALRDTTAFPRQTYCLP
ncbi:hypothetical protein [Streptomyces sp. NPDC029041]|uniref:hypothetical protein n=1 Tax=Streptomyces sp. NPDC029041 TaxID=3155727 RepID=UPI0033EADC82